MVRRGVSISPSIARHSSRSSCSLLHARQPTKARTFSNLMHRSRPPIVPSRASMYPWQRSLKLPRPAHWIFPPP